MRHLVCLLFVFGSVMSFSTASHAISVVETNKEAIYKPIVDRILEQMGWDAKASEENSTGRALQTQMMGEQSNANNAIATNRAQEVAMTGTHNKTMNLDSYACSYVTSTSGMSKAAETASQVTKEKLAQRLSVLSGDPGTASQNGLVDFQNKLFDDMSILGNDRFSMGYLFNTDNLSLVGPEASNLEYLQDLLYARVPVYLNQDLLDNPDTKVKNLSVQADRLRSEMAIGQSVFSIMQGNRAVTEGITAPKFLKEIMEKNGYSSSYLDELLPNNASLHAQLKALSVGQFGAAYATEKMLDNPEILNAGVLFNSMLTNLLLFKQYELLETIAASASTQVIATREEAIKDVNARISNSNSRN